MVFRFKCLEFLSIATETRHHSNSSSCQSVKTKSPYCSAKSSFPGTPNDLQLFTHHESAKSDFRKALQVFTYLELEQATGNFSSSSKIGDGESGSIYKAVIQYPDRKLELAVRRLKGRHIKQEQNKLWVREVSVGGVVEHPNLVKLVGCCAQDDERGTQLLLVYEYMPNRSVDDHLSTRSETPLSWTMRLKVAQDAACGLAYLHEEIDSQIIFGHFKSSNILLDHQWNAKLSDFGRLGSRQGLTHVSTLVIGTMEYTDPEYVQTGHLTSKSDVWSYGVFLYELITGRRPFDINRTKNEQKLLEWVKPYLDSEKFQLIIDSRLEGKYSLKSAQKLSIIANKCLSRDPKSRPKLSEVLKMVNHLIGGVPSHALNSLVPVVAIEESTKGKKTPEETKSKGERGSTDIQQTESACLPRICPSKLLKCCCFQRSSAVHRSN